MKLKSIILTLGILCLILNSNAQTNNVGINNNNPDASAILDVTSTDKGMLIPRMTTAQRNAIPSPATGLMVYDNTENSFFFYDGVSWEEIGKKTWDIDNNNNFYTLNSKVGIGINSPSFPIDLINQNSTSSIYNLNSYQGNNDKYGIRTVLDNAGTGIKYGIHTQIYGNPTNTNDKYGLYLNVDNIGSGTHYGIYSNAPGPGNYGIYSINTDDAGYAGFFLGRGYFSKRLTVGTNSQDNSAILQINSTDKGILIPRMSTAQRNAIPNPATGLLVYDIIENAFYYRKGFVWEKIGSNWEKSGNDVYFNSGEVGIGNNNPQEALDVDGTIRSSDLSSLVHQQIIANPNGNIEIDNQEYNYSISPMDFNPQNNVPYSRGNTHMYLIIPNNTNGRLYAPVQLPDGAKIKRVKIFYFDDIDPTNLIYEFRGISHANPPNFTSIYSFTSSGASSGLRTHISPNLNATINNEDNYYYFSVFCNNWSNLDTGIKSVLITYTKN